MSDVHQIHLQTSTLGVCDQKPQLGCSWSLAGLLARGQHHEKLSQSTSYACAQAPQNLIVRSTKVQSSQASLRAAMIGEGSAAHHAWGCHS